MTMGKALELFNNGQLTEAVSSAAATLRSKPMDSATRFLLAQLLCFQDEYEKADRQFETFVSQATQPVPGVALCRQLIRAAKCRQEFYVQGRVPEFFAPPSPAIEHLLKAWVHYRAGDGAAAQSSLEQTQEHRKPVAGTCNDNAFSDMLDLDDFLAPVLEVLTPTGKYFWVPLEELRSVTLKSPEKPMDLLWCPATIDVVNGPCGEAYVPVTYFAAEAEITESLRLGRATDWRESPEGFVRGVGQKCFLINDDDVAIRDMLTVSFTSLSSSENIVDSMAGDADEAGHSVTGSRGPEGEQ